jgi:hypothetical protein
MFLKLVFKSCSGMSLLAVAAGSSFRPAGAQILPRTGMLMDSPNFFLFLAISNFVQI